MKEVSSVLLDSSFCIRLLKSDADFHQNVVDYFEYFLENGIELYLSTIVVLSANILLEIIQIIYFH